jgi:hypothetical protein
MPPRPYTPAQQAVLRQLGFDLIDYGSVAELTEVDVELEQEGDKLRLYLGDITSFLLEPSQVFGAAAAAELPDR